MLRCRSEAAPHCSRPQAQGASRASACAERWPFDRNPTNHRAGRKCGVPAVERSRARRGRIRRTRSTGFYPWRTARGKEELPPAVSHRRAARVRYVSPRHVAALEVELKDLQRGIRSRRRLNRIAALRAVLQQRRLVLAPLLAAHGAHFHGHRIRRCRRAARDGTVFSSRDQQKGERHGATTDGSAGLAGPGLEPGA